MNLRAAISVPLPWLTLLTGKLFGHDAAKKRPSFFIFPRTLRFTKGGWLFTAVLFVIGIAAINTGNNLLYLIVATLLSFIIISGIMSESTLRKLKAGRIIPKHIYKERGADFAFAVENGKKFLPSYSFTVEELPLDGLSAAPAYAVKLDASKKIVTASEYTFKKRGVAKLRGMNFKTRFPFGLFVKGRAELSEEEVLVYPAMEPVEPEMVMEAAKQGAGAVRKKGIGGEFYGLRDHTLFDDSRYIHWKASARSGRLLRKEFEEEKEEGVIIIF
ncbi:MAG: DUF58 domain-containing protein, partial [Deltaproteobacteria bacterium]|nr:DUF58 domain-containing protein [Deltaproteobacteria bacterium]